MESENWERRGTPWSAEDPVERLLLREACEAQRSPEGAWSTLSTWSTAEHAEHRGAPRSTAEPVSYTHLRAHET